MATSAISTSPSLSLDSVNAAPILIQANVLRTSQRSARPAAAATLLDSSAQAISPLDCSPVGAVRRRALSARNVTAEIVQSAGEERIESHICSSRHTLIAYESGSRRDGMTLVDGLPPSSVKNMTRKFTFLPAGTELREWHGAHTIISAIYFHFDAETLPDGADTGSLPPKVFFEDDGLWDTVSKMKTMLVDSSADDRPYFDALAQVLAHEVVRRTRSNSPDRPLARGGLAPWQQRAAIAYIDSHLSEPIALATLAGIVRLSPYYFCRAFKQSLGVPPHRYHTNRRIEVAKELLVKRNQSITEIGLSLGFRETSSFSAAFRKATGTTPSSYQRSAS